MTTLRQAAQQALEALENVENAMYVTSEGEAVAFDKASEAITALRAALERENAMHEVARLGQEIEQEPSQWRDMMVVTLVREGIDKHRARELADHFAITPAEYAQGYAEGFNDACKKPEQEVSCRFCHSKKGCWAWQCYSCGEIDDVQKPAPPAAQPEQESVAWVCYGALGKRDIDFEEAEINKLPIGSLLYAAPLAAQRQWQGLTDEDWAWVADKKGTSLDTFDQGAAWAQARLKERNT